MTPFFLLNRPGIRRAQTPHIGSSIANNPASLTTVEEKRCHRPQRLIDYLRRLALRRRAGHPPAAAWSDPTISNAQSASRADYSPGPVPPPGAPIPVTQRVTTACSYPLPYSVPGTPYDGAGQHSCM